MKKLTKESKRIIYFLIYYLIISLGIITLFYFFLEKLFWMVLVIWIFTTFGVVSVSFFTLVNLRIEKLNELEKESKKDKEDKN
jgi:amino acid transporter